MSNPLLKPDDRFRRPALQDEQGRSLFHEDAVTAETKPELTPKQPESSTPAPSLAYQPRYEAVLPHRAHSISWLSTIGFLFTLALILPFVTVNYVSQGVIFGGLGVILSIIAAMQAFQELSGIAVGAVEPSGRDQLLIAYSIAMIGVVLGLGVIGWVMILVMYGTLDFNL